MHAFIKQFTHYQNRKEHIMETKTATIKNNLNHKNHSRSRSSINKILCLSLVFFYLVFINLPQARANSHKTIAITQIVQHPSLEEARRGIVDELKFNGYIDGKNLKIIYQNAQGNITNAALIAKHFASIQPDSIVAISTPSAQSIISSSRAGNIPIIFSSVTDPVDSGLVKDLNQPLEFITGAIDFPPIREEIYLIKKMIPNIKTLGLLYSAGESNSVKTIKLLKDYLGNELKIIEATPSSSNNVVEALNRLIGKVDAIYIPSDNVVFSAIPKIVQISRANKLPIFSSDPDSVREGFLACIGYTQYEVGRTAGQLLVRALRGEKYLTIEKPPYPEILINKSSADQIGLEIPEIELKIKITIIE